MVGWLGVLAKEIRPRRRIYPAVSTDSSVLRPLLAQFFYLLAGVEGLKGRAEGRSIVSETGCSVVYLCARQGSQRRPWRVACTGQNGAVHYQPLMEPIKPDSGYLTAHPITTFSTTVFDVLPFFLPFSFPPEWPMQSPGYGFVPLAGWAFSCSLQHGCIQ